MRFFTGVVFALMLLGVIGTATVSAETPFVALYFDQNFQVQQNNCPGMGILDTLYVVVDNIDTFLSAVDMQITYPPSVIFLADFGIPTEWLVIGNTASGMLAGFGSAPGFDANGLEGKLLFKVLIQYNCIACESPNAAIIVNTPVEFSDWPAYGIIPATGLTSLVCATVATEETTWGKVKALYSD